MNSILPCEGLGIHTIVDTVELDVVGERIASFMGDSTGKVL